MGAFDSLIHDLLIRSSASTYPLEQLQRSGLRMDLNLTNKKVRHLGSDSNPVYPEIIIWRPDYLGAASGQVIVVEAIETESTIENNLEKWRRLAMLGVDFNLVIPQATLPRVRSMLDSAGIESPTLHLQTYRLNGEQYEFTEVSRHG